jgi:preprotein translocase subunit SecG
MLNIIRLGLAVIVILLIVPQTPTENALVRTFYETRVFTDYGQAKTALKLLTWSCTFLFLIITFINAILN